MTQTARKISNHPVMRFSGSRMVRARLNRPAGSLLAAQYSTAMTAAYAAKKAGFSRIAHSHDFMPPSVAQVGGAVA